MGGGAGVCLGSRATAGRCRPTPSLLAPARPRRLRPPHLPSHAFQGFQQPPPTPRPVVGSPWVWCWLPQQEKHPMGKLALPSSFSSPSPDTPPFHPLARGRESVCVCWCGRTRRVGEGGGPGGRANGHRVAISPSSSRGTGRPRLMGPVGPMRRRPGCCSRGRREGRCQSRRGRRRRRRSRRAGGGGRWDKKPPRQRRTLQGRSGRARRGEKAGGSVPLTGPTASPPPHRRGSSLSLRAPPRGCPLPAPLPAGERRRRLYCSGLPPSFGGAWL